MPIHFDPVNHVYTEGDVTYRSVTQVLEELDISDTRFYKPEHAKRGGDVHSLLRGVLTGLIKPTDLSEHPLYGYIQAAKDYLYLSNSTIIEVEKMVANRSYRIAGTIDVILKDKNGANILVDWKTGALEGWHAVQLAGYAHLLEPEVSIDKRVIVCLSSIGAFRTHTEYRSRPFDSPEWMNIWKSAAYVSIAKRTML